MKFYCLSIKCRTSFSNLVFYKLYTILTNKLILYVCMLYDNPNTIINNMVYGGNERG